MASAIAAGVSPRLFDPHALAARGAEPQALRAFALAMASYRLQNERDDPPGLAFRLVRPDRQPVRLPWIWFAEDGTYLRRVRQDVFRVSLASARRDWFSEVECQNTDWPTFTCEDGRARRMSAPKPDEVVFDGVRFTRSSPESDAQEAVTSAVAPQP